MEKITLELTIDEVIMLQEISGDVECGSEWQDGIAVSLHRKSIEAYQKPMICQMEYEHHRDRIMQKYCPQFPKDAVIQKKLRDMEEAALRFYYKIIGGEEE